MTWIDGLALLTLVVAFGCGWRAGLIAELFDAGALVGATLITARWSPELANRLPPTWPLTDPARHLMAFWLFFVVLFAVIRVAGWLVAHYARRPHYGQRPRTNWVSGVGGGLIGAAKALVTLFALLYVSLFFPIDSQVRDTLRRSPLAIGFDRYFPPINEAIASLYPMPNRVFVRPIMDAHRL